MVLDAVLNGAAACRVSTRLGRKLLDYHIVPGLPVFVVSKVTQSTTHVELKGNSPHFPRPRVPKSWHLYWARSRQHSLLFLFFFLLTFFSFFNNFSDHWTQVSRISGSWKKKNPLRLAWERQCCSVLNSLKYLNIPDHLEAFLHT